MDIEGEGSALSLTEIEAIHKNKTAALFSASCAMGAIAGGGTAEEIAQLSRYGELLGMAFQIADDLLNETATEAELGKAVGSDRGRNKSTYVAQLGLVEAKNAANQMARSAIQNLENLTGPTEILRELAEFSVTRRN